MNKAAHARDVEGAVKGAWAEFALGSTDAPFDVNQAWEDTGADSLQAMHLLLSIETSLDCKLSFDVIGPHTTAASLACTLNEKAAASPDTTLPTVFLLPGLFGDEPRLAQFRRAFGGRIQFVVVEHPSLEKAASMASSMSANGKFAADAIEELAPAGDLRVAGYSFGGSVAFEAVRQLQERGRKVAMLCILDLILHNPSTAKSRHGWKHAVICGIAESDALRRVVLAIIARLWAEKLEQTRREMIAHLRIKAVHSWRPCVIAAPTLCAMSFETVAYQEARWPVLCSELRTLLRLPAGHLEIFDAESMKVLAPAFLSAVAVDPNASMY